MARLDVTDELIRELVEQVAPLVEDLTGWSLEIDSMFSRVVPKNQGFEQLLLARLEGAGVCVGSMKKRGWLERFAEYVIEGNLLGAYDSKRSELLIVRENVDDSNLDGLKLIVGHELVHRGQHVQYGELFDQLDVAIRECFAAIDEDDISFGNALASVDQVKPIMTLLESHANFIQAILERDHFPNARIESHFNIATLLMRLLGRKKLSQYTDGIPAVADAMQQGTVDELFAKAAKAEFQDEL